MPVLALVIFQEESMRRWKEVFGQVVLSEQAEQRQPLVSAESLAFVPLAEVVAARSFACRCQDRKSETAHCNRDKPRLGRSTRRARQALVRRLGNEPRLACVTPLLV